MPLWRPEDEEIWPGQLAPDHRGITGESWSIYWVVSGTRFLEALPQRLGALVSILSLQNFYFPLDRLFANIFERSRIGHRYSL